MQQKSKYYFLILLAMGISLGVSSYLLKTLFIAHNPTPVWSSFIAETENLRKMVVLIAQRPTPPTPTQPPRIAVEKTYMIQNGLGFSFFDTAPAPTAPLAPTDIPTPSPTLYIEPTAIPTSIPLPTSSTEEPNPTNPPVVRPTTKPTRSPTPTNAPKPTVSINFPKVVGDPLKQTWYGVGSLACYTTERFIKVYANGLTPNTCYNNIRAAIDSNIVSTTLLGRTIQVHKKALAAFEAVSKTLDQYKVDSSTYKFPSKTYKIKNVGAYIFRCNVNASTSAKDDTCATGCVLSPHAFGIGVDINYDENCNGCKNYDMPKEISDTFEIYGFRWGGHYPLLGSYIDPMHFEYMRDLCEGI